MDIERVDFLMADPWRIALRAESSVILLVYRIRLVEGKQDYHLIQLSLHHPHKDGEIESFPREVATPQQMTIG